MTAPAAGAEPAQPDGTAGAEHNGPAGAEHDGPAGAEPAQPNGTAGAGSSALGWDPAQYNRFAAEREQPFWDLAGFLRLPPGAKPRLADLGCGDGRLTVELSQRIAAAATVGVDSSPAMLEVARSRSSAGVEFVEGDLCTWVPPGSFDVVVSNAALQWVPDHGAVLERWSGMLAPGGQLAVQMPANADHPSHVVSRQLAAEWLGDQAPADPVASNVWPPEDYAVALHRLGFVQQRVELRVYGHLLDSPAAVVDWVKGTSLTRFRAVLAPDAFDRFVAEYGRRLVAQLGDQRPYFYPFKRILLWGLKAP